MMSKGILVIPDFLANAGGVIAVACELKGQTAERSFEVISSKIQGNLKALLDLVYKEKMYPREAAEKLVKERVLRSLEGGYLTR